MNKLLNKTLRTFALYSLVVLAASIPAYYYLVDRIWLRELDEHNQIIAERTEKELNKLQLTETELNQSIALWNKIQPGTNLKKATETAAHLDSTYTVLRQNLYVEHTDINRFRALVRLVHVNNEPYYLTVETNVEETEETVAAVAVITLLFFLILVVGFLFLSRRLSVRLWKPFRSTLSKLKTFNLDHQTAITFEKSDTLEFEELNIALDKLLEHTISVYKTQKEFTENASHELQTPLAIIKNKLDVLLQKEKVTDRQYQIIEEINQALTRITRMNKNLLLLAKIENHQFDDNETINISQLTQQCVEQFKEHSDNKNITVQTEIAPNVIEGNKILIEILLNNLWLNAIRHNSPSGKIYISLSKSELIISNSGNTELNPSAIFNRFAKTSNKSVGSGLGLSIIQQICNRHQWTIRYQFTGNSHSFSIHF
ncbi:sensor histidine kinase [Pedobacter sp. HMWF019]|uniref:sensor histidine kinase n=1 Tax=Pedobacter sp. HMWF019 TaxID=2056856 RepID=UPI000D3A36CC|nr:HAMP domain-containing sensor histidine kinase [Pedobacter sp. HMWF019]PTS92279.1 sensor histidine kinase [Pedobacter sp. HMWF019]